VENAVNSQLERKVGLTTATAGAQSCDLRQANETQWFTQLSPTLKNFSQPIYLPGQPIYYLANLELLCRPVITAANFASDAPRLQSSSHLPVNKKIKLNLKKQKLNLYKFYSRTSF
jgi:hypothetical protein